MHSIQLHNNLVRRLNKSANRILVDGVYPNDKASVIDKYCDSLPVTIKDDVFGLMDTSGDFTESKEQRNHRFDAGLKQIVDAQISLLQEDDSKVVVLHCHKGGIKAFLNHFKSNITRARNPAYCATIIANLKINLDFDSSDNSNSKNYEVTDV